MAPLALERPSKAPALTHMTPPLCDQDESSPQEDEPVNIETWSLSVPFSGHQARAAFNLNRCIFCSGYQRGSRCFGCLLTTLKGIHVLLSHPPVFHPTCATPLITLLAPQQAFVQLLNKPLHATCRS